jgi:hypothetical protein
MGAMDTSTIGHNHSVSQRLHPFVYKAIFALAVVFLLGVWEFAGDEYTGYLIAVVAGLVFVALALPFVLWRIRRSHRRRGRAEESDAPEKETFGDWAAGDFQGWQDREKAGNAAVEVLLPIAAVAFGMVAFSIVSSFT